MTGWPVVPFTGGGVGGRGGGRSTAGKNTSRPDERHTVLILVHNNTLREPIRIQFLMEKK